MNTDNTNTTARINLKVTPRRPALLAGFDNTIDILIQIEGPEAPIDKPQRTPLNLSLVLDRSGSMAGLPLAEAVSCAQFIVENLEASDRASLVVYDNQVNVLVSNRELQDKASFLEALRTIRFGGGTDLHGGWLQGAQEAAAFVSPTSISRVLLLSDGQANSGLTDLKNITQQCAQLADTGVSTSTYGLGLSFNEELMTSMASSGLGNSYYGECADDLMESFQREFDLLSALFAQQVCLRIQPQPGVEVLLLNPYMKKEGAYILPDVAYGGVAWAIVRAKVPARLTSLKDGEAQSIFEVMVSANDMSGQVLTIPSMHLQLTSLPTPAWNTICEDESVIRRVGEVEVAALQDAARSAARKRDWITVNRLLKEARLKAPDNPWVLSVLATLEEIAQQRDAARFSKEAMYSSKSMSSRLSSLQESAEFNLEMENNSLSYLRRKEQQGKQDPFSTNYANASSKKTGASELSTPSISELTLNNSPPNRITKWLKNLTHAVGLKKQ